MSLGLLPRWVTSASQAAQAVDAALDVTRGVPNTVYVSENGDDSRSGINDLSPVRSMTRANAVAATLPGPEKQIVIVGPYVYPLAGTPDSGTYTGPVNTRIMGLLARFTAPIVPGSGADRVWLEELTAGLQGNNVATFSRDTQVWIRKCTGIVTWLGGTHETTEWICTYHEGELRNLTGDGDRFSATQTTVAPRITPAARITGPGIRIPGGRIVSELAHFSAHGNVVNGIVVPAAAPGVSLNVWALTAEDYANECQVSEVTIADPIGGIPNSQFLKIENFGASLLAAQINIEASFTLRLELVTAVGGGKEILLEAETWFGVEDETPPGAPAETTPFSYIMNSADPEESREPLEGFFLVTGLSPIYLRYTARSLTGGNETVNAIQNLLTFKVLAHKAVTT